MKEKIRKVFFFECATNEGKNKESFFLLNVLQMKEKIRKVFLF